jgi:hypothetical protein
VLLALLIAGCALPGRDRPLLGGSPTILSPTPAGPPLSFGGEVRDVTDGKPPAAAAVRIDLSQVLPCKREGIVWSSWSADVDAATGRWGPVVVPRPNSNDVAFFVHADAPGYDDHATFVGPTEARGDVGNLTAPLNPTVTLNGTAPPGTVLAVAADPSPLVVLADPNGTFRFVGAPAVEAPFVAALSIPFATRVHAPQTLVLHATNGTGWALEARLRTAQGQPLAGDVAAWNGTQLASAARAGLDGAFTLPLAPRGQTLQIDARTSDGRYAGTLALEVQGPPGATQTVTMQPLC